MLLSQVHAGGMGAPFIPVRGLIGSDLLTLREDFRVMEDPFSPGERVAVVPAVRPDVALFHARVADRFGAAITAPRTNDSVVYPAARCVLVTAERIVDGPLPPCAPTEGTFIPSLYVSAVAEAPQGARPTPCHGAYPVDEDAVRAYAKAALDPATWREWLDRHVFA